MRHNYFYNTAKVICAEMYGSSGLLHRMLVLNNLIEWPVIATFTSPEALRLSGSASLSFKKLVIRDNIIRRMDSSTNGSEVGMQLTSWEDAIVENNVIDLGAPDSAFVEDGSSPQIKFFNNLMSDGTLLRGYNTAAGRHDRELADDLEDAAEEALLGVKSL